MHTAETCTLGPEQYRMIMEDAVTAQPLHICRGIGGGYAPHGWELTLLRASIRTEQD